MAVDGYRRAPEAGPRGRGGDLRASSSPRAPHKGVQRTMGVAPRWAFTILSRSATRSVHARPCREHGKGDPYERRSARQLRDPRRSGLAGQLSGFIERVAMRRRRRRSHRGDGPKDGVPAAGPYVAGDFRTRTTVAMRRRRHPVIQLRCEEVSYMSPSPPIVPTRAPSRSILSPGIQSTPLPGGRCYVA